MKTSIRMFWGGKAGGEILTPKKKAALKERAPRDEDDHFYGAWYGRQGGRATPRTRAQVFSAPAKPTSPLDSVAVQAAIAQGESKVRFLPWEHAIGIDANGYRVLDRTDYHERDVMMEYDVGAKPVIEIHNHPAADAAHSPHDVMGAWVNPSIRETRVVTPGHTYSIKPGPDGKWGSKEKYMQLAEEAVQKFTGQALNVSDRERPRGIELANPGEISHLYWQYVAQKMGWEYTRTPYTGPKQLPPDISQFGMGAMFEYLSSRGRIMPE